MLVLDTVFVGVQNFMNLVLKIINDFEDIKVAFNINVQEVV